MKMYLPFGDWACSSHCQHTKVLIDAPSMAYVAGAQKRISYEYGEDFWNGFCQKYQDNSISDKIQEVLINTAYPLERFGPYVAENYQSLNEFFESDCWLNDYECRVTLDLCVDMFIWIMNAHGARIEELPDIEDIPTISNWTCPGFKTVGYGCFDL